MKKIFFISIVFLMAFSSCQKDDSLDPRPSIVSGNFVRLDITRGRLNIDDLAGTSFGGSLTNPGGKCVKYNLYVRRTDGQGTVYGDFKLVKAITSFPADLSIYPADIASALGVTITTLKQGDIYRFYGEAFDAEGNRSDFYSLSSVIQSNMASYKEAFRFQTDMTDSIGMLDVLENYVIQ